MKNDKITMQTIADRLGITKVSVSKALNGQPGISDKLRGEIVRTALELGYSRKNVPGRQKSNSLAFVVPKRFFLENENFYTTIYYYLNKRCQTSGQALSNFVVNSHEESGAALPHILKNGLFDGIFVAGEIDDGYLRRLMELQIPVVLIDFYKAMMNLDCIITDNFYLGYCATNYLVESGHRNIGFIGDVRETASIMDRYYGYRKALESNRLPVNESWHLVNNDPRTGVYTLDYALPDPMPTAFVCHCDMAAYFLIQSLVKAGFSIPGDVSVISFDNTDLSRGTTPKLSTFDIDRKEIADKAFDQMMLRIENAGAGPQRVYISNHFIERESVRSIESP
jgi:LacI family transcriptional regulator